MTENEYDKAYEAGRSGGLYTGGNSIDAAGYAAGEPQRRQAEAQASRGGGGAINFKGKVVLVGIGFGMLGMFWGFISTQSWLGGIIGFVVAGTIGMVIRLLIAALAWPLRIIGRLLPFLLPAIIGFFVGAGFGGVASDQNHTPREPTMIQYGIAGAVILVVLWFLRRQFARRRTRSACNSTPTCSGRTGWFAVLRAIVVRSLDHGQLQNPLRPSLQGRAFGKSL